jgi:transcription antitermination factor NusG
VGRVHDCLRARRVEAFYPAAKFKPFNPRASEERTYFPKYLFVNADLGDIGVSALQRLPATSLGGFGGEPAIVSETLNDELKCRIADVGKSGGLHPGGLKSGDTVKITDGPFSGCEGIF